MWIGVDEFELMAISEAISLGVLLLGGLDDHMVAEASSELW